ncbi:ribosome biogenesis protein ytm1 [Coemansia sp. RSA 2681]|nr:ribosome biogenesis protein ytm1 [Coemansia sp. RSA 2681]
MLSELEDDSPLLVDAQAVDLLQVQYLKKRSALKAELDYLMAEMYQINDAGSSVVEMVVSYCVMSNYDDVPYENPVTLGDLFFALTNLDLYRDKMDVLADALIHRWFIPLLRNPNELLAVSKVKLFATINIGAYTASASSRSNGDELSVTQTHCELVRDKWSTVLDFIRDEMFHDVSIDEDHLVVYEYLGSKLWTALCPLLHEALLIPMVPADIDAIGDTQHMVPLLELEERWLELGLIAADQLSIKDSIRALLQTYVSKRRRDLLTTIASILATDDANTVVVGGDGPVTDMLCDYAQSTGGGGKKGGSSAAKGGKGAFAGAGFDEDCDSSLAFPRCSISVHAQTLVEFARETIGFTAGSGEEAKTAALYFHAVRDAFALYRCLLPCQWSAALVSDPKRAFVMYNDCEFICHHLSTLGFRYQDKWPHVLRASATFVDVIAAYRALSKACLSPLLTRLRTQIAQALGPSEWLQPGWLSSMVDDGAGKLEHCYEACEAQLALACGIVGQVAHVGAAHLPKSMYLRVLGLLVDVAVGHVSRRFEEIGSASDSTARALVRLATPIAALEDWFRPSYSTSPFSGSMPPSFSDGAVQRGGGRAGSLIAKYCKEWDAFQIQISRLGKMASHIATTGI